MHCRLATGGTGARRAADAGACRHFRFLRHGVQAVGAGLRARRWHSTWPTIASASRPSPNTTGTSINLLQKMPVLKAEDSPATCYAELDLAIRNAEKNPDGVFLGFERFDSMGKGSFEENTAFLTRYVDWPDPVVKFVVHKKLGNLLCWQKQDPAGLKHFDRAIEVMEAACKRLTVYYRVEALHDIYRLQDDACEHCGRPEEAEEDHPGRSKGFP